MVNTAVSVKSGDQEVHNLILSEEGKPNSVDSGPIYASKKTIRRIFQRRVQGLLLKRALNFKRDKKAWFCSTIIPSLLSLLGFLTVRFGGPSRSFEQLVLSTDDLNPDVMPDVEVVRNPLLYNPSGTCVSCGDKQLL